jgi:Uma2 family endonuclease
MATTDQVFTAEQLFHIPDRGRCELIRGEVIKMPPSGSEHGWIALNFAGPLRAWARRSGLGRVFGAETGFIIERGPDTVRAPDAAYVRNERLPSPLPKEFFPGSPDLAVEVRSPRDRKAEILAKVQSWLEAGTVEVWLADPATSTVTIYRDGADVRVLTAGQSIESDLLPGFSLPLGEVFDEERG